MSKIYSIFSLISDKSQLKEMNVLFEINKFGQVSKWDRSGLTSREPTKKVSKSFNVISPHPNGEIIILLFFNSLK